MKHLLRALLLLLVTCGSGAWASTVLSVSTSTPAVRVGNEVTVTVNISCPKLNDLVFGLSFDNQKLEFVSVAPYDWTAQAGAAHELNVYTDAPVAGKNQVAVHCGNPLGFITVPSSGGAAAALVSFKLRALSAGTCVLQFSSITAISNFTGKPDTTSSTSGTLPVYVPPGNVHLAPAGGGTYRTAQEVTLTATGALHIYYTLDGSDPDQASAEATGPVTVDAAHGQSVTVRARAYSYENSYSPDITSATFAFDKQAPRVLRVTAPPGTGGWLKAGDAVPFTVDFDEAAYLTSGSLQVVFQTDAGDRTVLLTGLNGVLAASGSYTVQAGDACANQALNVRSLGVSSGGSMDDACGNVMTPAEFAIPTGSDFADVATVHFDTVLPTSSISTSGAFGPSQALTQVTGTAADSGGSGLAHVEVTLQRTSDNNYWSGGAWLASVQWLPVTGTTAWSLSLVDFPFVDGRTYAVHARAVDAAGNVQATASSSSFSWDASPPTVTLGAPSPVLTKKGGVVSYPVTITGGTNINLTAAAVTVEIVSGLATASWIGVTNGTTATPTVQILTGDGAGELAIRLAAGCALDAAGNPSLATPLSQAFTVDTAVPGATLTTGATSPTNLASLPLTLTFTKAVTGTPATAAFTLANGSVTAVTPTSDRTFAVSVAPSADGLVSIALNADAVADAAGNGNTASNTVSLTSDRTLPSNPVPRQPNPVPNTPTTNNSVSFAGWLNSGDVADASGVAGYAWVADTSATTMPDSNLQTLPTGVTFPAPLEGTVVYGYLHVRTLDKAGNWSDPAHLGPWIIDWQDPAVTVNQAPGQPDPTGALPIHFTAVFSETVTGFDASDVTLGGTAARGSATVTVLPLGGNSYDIAVDGVTGIGMFTVTATIDAGRVVDLVGNPNTASTSTDNSITLDRSLPAAVVSQAGTQADPTNTEPLHFTLLFTKPINGLAASDFVLAGTAGHQNAQLVVTETAPLDRTHFAVAVSGMTGSGTVILELPAGTVLDDAQNPNVAATAQDNQVMLDRTPPSVVVSLAAGQSVATNALPLKLHVQFSEPVTGFDVTDCVLAGTAGHAQATLQLTELAPLDGSTFEIQIGGLTSDGSLTLSVPAGAAVDVVGNLSTASTGGITVDYDTQAPAVQLSGVPASPTNQTVATLTVGGTGVVAYRYELDNGSFGAETAVASPISLSGLTGGAGTVHTVRVIGRDAAGNWQAQLQATVATWTVDTQAPTATVAGVPASPTNQTSASLTIAGTEVMAYRYALDGGSYGEETPVATAIQLSNLAGGAGTQHTVRVMGRDTAGNWQATATAVSWLVDTDPPTALLSGVPTNPTNQTSALITVSGTDVVAYRYAVDGGAYSSETAVATVISLSNLAGGVGTSHHVTVLGRDTAGNWQSVNSPTTASWIIDTSVPAAPPAPLLQATSDTGGSSGDRVTADNHPAISGTAEVGTTVRVYADGVLAGTASAATGAYTFTFASALADGVRQLRVTAVDAAGNVSALSDFLTVTILTVPPVAQLDGLPETLTTQNYLLGIVSGDYVVAYKYTVDNPNIDGASVRLVTDVIIVDYLDDGVHILRVKALDVAGNWQTTEQVTLFTWEIDTTAPAAPARPVLATASDSGISDSDAITATTTPTITTVAEPGTMLQFSVNGQAGTPPIQVPGDGHVSQAFGPLSDGSYAITADATDVVGNRSAGSETLTLVIDTQAPQATASSLPQDPSGTTSVQITVGGTGVSHYRYRLDAGALGALTAVANPVALANLSSGQHTLVIIGYDLAGNHLAEAEAFHYSWTVDTNVPVNPVLTSSVPQIGHSTGSAMVTGLGWTTGEGIAHAGYTWVVDTAASTAVAEAAQPTATLPTELALAAGDGSYWLHLRTKGINGLWSSTIHYGPWTQDTLPPAALLSNPPANPTRAYTFLLQVGGAQVTAYIWRLVSETDWSAETPVATLLQLGSEQAPLADGQHQLQLRGRDEAGNWQAAGSPSQYTWLVDTVSPDAPQLSATPPTGAAVFTNQLTATLSWQPATDTGSGIGGYLWVLDRNATGTPPLRTLETQLPASVNFTLGPADYYLHVRSFDLAGNNRVDHFGPWRLDTQAPHPPTLLSATPAAGTETRTATVALQWQSATDTGAAGVEGYAWVVDQAAGTDPAAGNPAPQGLPASIQLTGGDGAHWLHVRTRDKAGNWSTTLTSGPWTLDTVAPTASVTGTPISPTTQTTASLTVAGAGVTAYRFSLDGGAYGPETPSSTGLQLSGLTGGTGTQHTVRVIGRDAAGNWQLEAVATAVTWLVDTVAPVAVLNGVPASPTSQLTATLTVNGADVVSYSYSLDGGAYGAETACTVPISLTGLTGGAAVQHTVRVIGRDTAGNWQLTDQATVGTWTIDTVSPSVPPAPQLAPGSDTGSGAADGITSENRPVILGSAETGATVAVFVDGLPVGSVAAGDGTYQYRLVTALADGVHQLRVTATDVAGNDSGLSDILTVVISTVPPAAPLVSGTDPQATTNRWPTWQWSSATQSAGPFRFRLDNPDVAGGAQVTTATNWQPSTAAYPEGLALGSHTLYVQVQDVAGNWSTSGSYTYTVLWEVLLNLKPGWNLASFPGEPLPADLDALLTQAGGPTLWSWSDGAYVSDEAPRPYAGLWFQVAATMAPFQVSVRGTTTTAPAWQAGWNLVGVGVTTSVSGLPASVLRPVWQWDAALGMQALKGFTSDDVLTPGMAYWIYVW